MIFRKIIFILSLLPGFAAVGQQLQFDNFGQSLPLPSQECYNIMQDNKGYIWFATEQGFCRYDGSGLCVFDRKNGLEEAAVYSVAEDRNGKIWMATSKSRILVYADGILKEAPFSAAYASQREAFDVTYSLAIDGDKLYINSERQTFVANINSRKLTKLTHKFPVDFSMLKIGKRIIPANGSQSPRKVAALLESSDFTINITDGRDILKSGLIGKKMQMIPNLRTIFVNSGNTNFFSTGNKLLRIDSQLKISTFDFPQRILSMHIDSDGGLWIGTFKKGLYYYPKADLSRKPIISLGDYSVTGILADAEKNIWCTTLEKGIFISRNKNVINYFNIPQLARPADMIKSIGDTQYLSSGNNDIVSIEDDSITHHKLHYFSKEKISDIAQWQGRLLLCGDQLIAQTNSDFSVASPLAKEDSSQFGAMEFKMCDGRLFGLGSTALIEIVGSKVKVIRNISSRTRCFEYLSDGEFLCGSSGALELIDSKTGKATEILGISERMTKILKTKSAVWITTKGGGLYQYAGGQVISMKGKVDLPTGILYDMIAYNNDLWIGSNMGLLKISKVGNSFKTIIFGMVNGLPAHDIYKLSRNGDTLFLSTADGICSFSLESDLRNNVRPRIYLNAIKVNNISQTMQGNFKLESDENAIAVVFDALAFKSATLLWCRLYGRDSDFSVISGNVITLDNLRPGAYSLVVYALNSDGLKSLHPVTIKFEIAKPFWMAWWFIALAALLLGGTIYWIIGKNIKRIQRREEEKTRTNKLIAESQLSALQAQMNPHFIFNAINSIQNYILKKKEKEAYHYLARFSKLIRLILHQSQQHTLVLHEEIETLKLYVELEQLRFDDSFDFEIAIDDAVDEFATEVPAMLIQPFLENAIWHGLMHLESARRGKLTLRFSEENNLLKIAIEDNGIGRAQSAAYAKDSHKPVATNLAAQRLAIVNQWHKNADVRIVTVDLANGGEPSGTIVILYLPLTID